MIGRQPSAQRRDLPLGYDESGRFLPWIIAVMVYLAALGGIGLIVLGGALRQWDRSLAGSLTVQVPADTSTARTDTILALLRQTAGVVSVRLLDQSETARLLEPWLGPSVPMDMLPVPRIIDLRVDPDAPIDFAQLQQRLISILPEAKLDQNRLWLAQLRGFALRVESTIAAIVAIVVALMVLAVVFTARTGLTICQPLIELLHLLGAGDPYIARQFQAQALRQGLIGGLAGSIATAATVLGLASAGRVLDLSIADGIADWRIWLLIVGAALAAGLIAMATARLTVLRYLARLP